MPDLPLTKSLDPADYLPLAPVLDVVDAHFADASPQHPARRWEYAMALHAWSQYARGQEPRAFQGLDVGGAGSPLTSMLASLQTTPIACRIIDPVINQSLEHTMDILPYSQDAIFCISVLEHVDFVLPLLRIMHRMLVAGGLLFLTMDGCDAEGPDVYHFHWMRKRIYHPERWKELYKTCHALGFTRFGGVDWVYRGAQVFDYTFLTLVLKKGA